MFLRLVPPYLLLLVLGACATKTATELAPGPGGDTYLTQRVVLIIIDGLRYSEGLGDPDSEQVPRMAALARRGTIVEPFHNDGPTVTRFAVPAIWSGSWQPPEAFFDPDCGGTENQRSSVPTVFEYYRKFLNRPAVDCVYVVGQVGCPWKASVVPGYGPGFWPVYEERGGSDTERWERARAILAEDKPRFLLLYLPDVDHAGHSGDWDAYLASIAIADGIVGALWDALEDDPFYAGQTTLFVTNDHGRHDNRASSPHGGFSGHGDSCDGCRTIEMLVVGPDVRRGFVSNQPRAIPDIVPTIGELLGFPTPQATGVVMVELLNAERSRGLR